MSGSLSQLYLSNPALANAMRRQQFGQGLAQEGMSTAPTGPWGALARLAQAYVGGKMMDSGEQDIQKAGDDMREEARQFMMPTAGSQPAQLPAPVTTGPATGGGGLPVVPPELMQHYEAASRETGIPVHVLIAKDRQESNFNNNLRGGAGEIGISQILPSTAAAPGYGIDPVPAAALQDAATNIRFGARYLGARGKAAGVTDWNDPNQMALGLKAYNGGGDPNYVANVSRYLPPSGGAPGGGAPSPPAPGGMPGGAAENPYVQEGRRLQQRAQAAKMSPNPFIRDQAPVLMQQAAALMQMDQFKSFTGPDGTEWQVNTRTGEKKPANPGTGRSFQDQQGNMWIVPPGGGAPYQATTNPSGVTGNGPEQNALRLMTDLAPAIRSGQATPQQQDQYAAAVQTYIGTPHIMTDPATNKMIEVPRQQLPAGFPMPRAATPAGSPGAPAPVPGAPKGTKALTQGGFGEKNAANIDASTIEDAIKKLDVEHAAAIDSNAKQSIETQMVRSMLPEITTGVGGNERLMLSRALAAFGLSDEYQKRLTGTSAPAGEVARKLLFEWTTGKVKGMGREPGYILQMFAQNNPNLTDREMTIDLLSRLTDSQNRYTQDELAARREHWNAQKDAIRQGQPSTGLTTYQQPNARVYAAAAAAASGMPYSVWSKGLSREQILSVPRLGSGIWPDMKFLDENNKPHQPVRQ